MSFEWINMLWLLLLIPVLVLIYILIQRKRQRYALKFASFPLMKQALGSGPGIRRHIPPIMFLAALAIMILALARPSASVKLPSQQATVILTIDVSMSMRAEDVKPNRLEAAKAAALRFVEKQPKNVRIGIVSFSGFAALVQAPTEDREAIRAAINRLDLQYRTAIGSAILTSLSAIFEEPEQVPEVTPSDILIPEAQQFSPAPVQQYTDVPAVIILLSDGRNTTGPGPLEVIDQAINHGVHIYTVGVGSPEGAIMSFGGRSMFMRFDEETLKSIAERTEAEYYKADNEADLLDIYDKLSTELVLLTKKTELTAIFTGVAVILILIGGAFSMLWFNRLP